MRRRVLPARVPALRDVTAAVRHHHERYDGSGYPDRLAGEVIPLEARIVAAADVYWTIASERPYRRRRGWDQAIDELRGVAGSQLDPDVVEALVRVLCVEAPHGAEAVAGVAR